MIELRGKKVVLRTMEREHCRTLWEHYELEEPIPTEPVRPGHSLEGSEKWFEEIQEQQGKTQVYLGIFSPDGNLLGDIQLSEIDLRNRTASLGAGIARRRDRGKGYCTDAALVILRFGFEHLDLYRIRLRQPPIIRVPSEFSRNSGLLRRGASVKLYIGPTDVGTGSYSGFCEQNLSPGIIRANENWIYTVCPTSP